MKYIIASCICTVIVSAIVNKMIAIHYIQIIDSYTKDITEIIKELIRTTYFQK